NQRRKQELFRFVPKGITAFSFASGVGHKGCHQLQDVLFAVDIVEGIITHGLLEVDGVENLDAVTFLHKRSAYLKDGSSFGVCENIGTVHLQEIGLDPEAGLAA